jgi:SAM-dependent methyltransferase
MSVPAHAAQLTPFTRRLVDEASAMFRPAGSFAWRFSRGKLGGDPLFVTLLRTGAIPDAACLVDLGCGQGLLAAWIHVARRAWTETPDQWPTDWPVPANVGMWLGIDRSAQDIRRAHAALPAFARSLQGDVRTLGTTLLERYDVATLFDVLQYLDPGSQERLLVAVHSGLRPWGVLLLRVGDGVSSLRARRTHVVDLVVCSLRGHPRLRLHRRPVDQWIALLGRVGFVVEVLDDQRTDSASKYGNVLIRASRSDPAIDATSGSDLALNPGTVR